MIELLVRLSFSLHLFIIYVSLDCQFISVAHFFTGAFVLFVRALYIVRILTICLLYRLQKSFPVCHLSFNFIYSIFYHSEINIFFCNHFFWGGGGLYFLRPVPLQDYKEYSSICYSSTFILLLFTSILSVYLQLI